MIDYSVEELMKDGFSEKYAKFFNGLINKEVQRVNSNKEYDSWALDNGFLSECAYAYNLTDKNKKNYLSDYDYYKSWPLNCWSKIWVDDKMTLKYILQGTRFNSLMPEYYFYSKSNGLRELVDNPIKGEQSIETLYKVLQLKRELACKPNNGTMSRGFVKLEYNNNEILLNGTRISIAQLQDFVLQNPNYIFTEYLHPEHSFSKVFPLIHTFRVNVLNKDGNNPEIIGGYFRFGTFGHGEANYMNEQNGASFNYVAQVDFSTGHVYNPKAFYYDRVIDMPRHPDTNKKVDLKINNWAKIREGILDLSKYLFNIEWLGFDFCITDKGVRLMEINTHPEIKPVQYFSPLFLNSRVKCYFDEKLKKN